MLISDKMVKALNTQIGNEFGAFIQYVEIASHFGSENLPELSRHFYHQAEEEKVHALKIVKYVVDARGKFASAEEAVKLSLDWEETVTKQINGLVDLAIAENDHTSRNFLQWFVAEQLEEVSSMDMLLSMVRRAGEQGLLFVEEFLARHKGMPVSTSVSAEGAE